MFSTKPKITLGVELDWDWVGLNGGGGTIECNNVDFCKGGMEGHY